MTIGSEYINALLANSAYVEDLTRGMSPDGVRGALGTRMTPALADYISQNFEVASIGGAAYTSGFNAVVWRGRVGTEFDGQFYVSMRGTAGTADLLADVDLAANGAARAQYMDMVNWWLKATAPVGQQAKQITMAPAGTGSSDVYFVAASTVAGTGELVGVTHVEVDGHSLGGHLATAFARLFGGSVGIDQITTFNSPGFKASSEAVFQQINALIGTGLGRYPTASEQTNLFAQNGLSFTTNSLWFGQIGQRISVYNEEGIVPANHAMYKLTDALALANAMSKLDITLTTSRVNTFFELGSNNTAGTLEGVLDGLRRVLLDPKTGALPVGDASDSASTRVIFHQTLKQLQDSDAFKALAGKVRIDASSKDLAAKARNDFSALASLASLSPVVLTATNAASRASLDGVLKTVWGQTYDDWRTDKGLSAAEQAAGKATFTDAWIADRVAMVDWMMLGNARDLPSVITAGNSGRAIPESLMSQDLSLGKLLMANDDNNAHALMDALTDGDIGAHLAANQDAFRSAA